MNVPHDFSPGRHGRSEYIQLMPRRAYVVHHRTARNGNLGPLACSMHAETYQWFLCEVYDLRFPHIGDDRHPLNRIRSFDSLGGGFRVRLWNRLATGRRVAA